MMTQETLEDMKVYLRDEGLDDEQIGEFIQSHDLPSLTEYEGWEVIESHIFRDL